jgi:hypothetical protein
MNPCREASPRWEVERGTNHRFWREARSAISNAFQSDGKVHARLSASNVGFKTQIFANAVD